MISSIRMGPDSHSQLVNNCLLTRFLPRSAAASIYFFKTATRHRASPELIGSRNCLPMAFTTGTVPVNLKVIPKVNLKAFRVTGAA